MERKHMLSYVIERHDVGEGVEGWIYTHCAQFCLIEELELEVGY